MRAAALPEAADTAGRRHAWLLPSVVAGIVAGSSATLVELALWWLLGQSPLDNLLRDARLTAALALGSAVLAPAEAPKWLILLVATLIHYALSVLYASVPARWCGRWSPGRELLAGACYGVLIYAVNLHGFVRLFPWFEQVRDAVTLTAHVVFGVALVVTCRLDRQYRRAASGRT